MVWDSGTEKGGGDGDQPSNSGATDISDLTKLEDITLQSVLDCLIQRFHARKYCTFAGSVLIALNPCSSTKRHSLLNTYENEDVKRFVEISKNPKDLDVNHLEPHVLSLGVKSLYNIGKVRNNQVVVVSGDSGAGKTTVSQDLIKFFTYSENETSDDIFTLEKKIYEATLILEALGNASTSANPNSSRFGRLVRLHYNKDCKIVGAEIKTYLLEKHRVPHSKGNAHERNFHIFHYLLQAIEQGYLDGRNKDVFNDAFWAGSIQESDLSKFKNLSSSLIILDLLDHFIQVFEFLFAIMHLLAITFEVENIVEASDKENFSAYRRPSHFVVSDLTQHHLASASQILGLKEADLHNSLVYQTFAAGNRKSISLSPCARKEDCESRLHSFISTLYERLFNQIVDLLNSLLNQTNDRSATIPEADKGTNSTVSILDLYGFENLDFNGFEQLIINYANERVQQVQISVLKGYFEEERRIGTLFSSAIQEPKELNRVEKETDLRLDELHQRIFCILDEACMLKRSTPDKEVFEQLAMKSKHDKFIKTGRLHDDQCQFVIQHYASDVNYSMAGMITKNKDFIPEEFTSMLSRSVKPFVCDLFPPKSLGSETVSTPGKRKPEGRKTILMRFKSSVNELVGELCEKENRDVHFIKCIRPNSNLVAKMIQPKVVEQQLFACGIVDIIRIAGNGFPIRLSRAKFEEAFPLSVKKYCGEHFCEKRFMNVFCSKSCDLKFGKSYVFMSENSLTQMHKREWFIRHCAARRIQNIWRAYSLALERQRQTQTPVKMDTSSCNTSIYFTPMTSGATYNSSESYFSTFGPHSYDDKQNTHSLNQSGGESPIESGISMSNSSSGEDWKHSSINPSWFNDSHDENPSNSTEDTIAAYSNGRKSNILLSSTFLSDASEAQNSPNDILDNQTLQLDFSTIEKHPCLRPTSVQISVFCGNGIISRTPVHSGQIKIYTKKTALGYIKPPQRLTANGITDAYEEYGLVIEPILYPPQRVQRHVRFCLHSTTMDDN